ncbi:hypothetical protein BDZ94DRAFT_1312958 [Collybia nuda]|uniref:Uncharacterized protein n=1 Tax=Collybia nuda TaxID=64659 RepID=A0A9P5XZZ3_9AGAR|nr:hypothetical protein BDZ94DRAFT_1312958 [Collybia nuda]
MPLSAFHRAPANKNFPKHRFIKQAQEVYFRFIVPYYAVACKAGKRVAFLEALYPIWFNRFPVTECDDPEELEWEKLVQQKFLARKLLWAGACKITAPLDQWVNIINLEADRTYRAFIFMNTNTLVLLI